MAQAVIILHPSEIIRKGLTIILENEISIKIISISDSNQVTDRYLTNYSDLIMILPIELNNRDILVKYRSKATRLLLVGIEIGNSKKSSRNLFDITISLNDSSAAFLEHINRFFSTGEISKDDDELTLREKEVLRFIALGHTNKSIADILYISTHTVISHRKNITEKLGIKSIPGLTVYAIIQKIISQSDIAKDQLL